MSAPPHITLRNLSGDYVLNKQLSDDASPLLALQNINWFMRKMLSMATVTLHVIESEDENQVTHIDIENLVSGKNNPSTEQRILDWQERERDAPLFGKLRLKAQWTGLEGVEDQFLKTGWSTDMNPSGFIQSRAESMAHGWKQDQVWGFQEVKGERRYVRHVVVIGKDGERKEAKFVYDYLG